MKAAGSTSKGTCTAAQQHAFQYWRRFNDSVASPLVAPTAVTSADFVELVDANCLGLPGTFPFGRSVDVEVSSRLVLGVSFGLPLSSDIFGLDDCVYQDGSFQDFHKLSWSLSDLRGPRQRLELSGDNGFTNLSHALTIFACVAKACLNHQLAADILAVRAYFEDLHRFEPFPRVDFTAAVLHAHFITLWEHYLAQIATEKFNRAALFQTFGANIWMDPSRVVPGTAYIRFWVVRFEHGQLVESPFFRLIARERPAQQRLGQFAVLSSRLALLESQAAAAGPAIPRPAPKLPVVPKPAPAPAPAPAKPAPAPAHVPVLPAAPTLPLTLFVATDISQIDLNQRQWAGANSERLSTGLPLLIGSAVVPWTAEFCYRCLAPGHHYKVGPGCSQPEHPRAFKLKTGYGLNFNVIGGLFRSGSLGSVQEYVDALLALSSTGSFVPDPAADPLIAAFLANEVEDPGLVGVPIDNHARHAVTPIALSSDRAGAFSVLISDRDSLMASFDLVDTGQLATGPFHGVEFNCCMPSAVGFNSADSSGDEIYSDLVCGAALIRDASLRSGSALVSGASALALGALLQPNVCLDTTVFLDNFPSVLNEIIVSWVLGPRDTSLEVFIPASPEWEPVSAVTSLLHIAPFDGHMYACRDVRVCIGGSMVGAQDLQSLEAFVQGCAERAMDVRYFLCRSADDVVACRVAGPPPSLDWAAHLAGPPVSHMCGGRSGASPFNTLSAPLLSRVLDDSTGSSLAVSPFSHVVSDVAALALRWPHPVIVFF
jgi:hypothetical protein